MSLVKTIRVDLNINIFLLLLFFCSLFIVNNSFSEELESRQALSSPPIIANQDFEHRLIIKFKDNIQMRSVDKGPIV